MIARIWRGVVRRADGDEYADYIRETGFNEYAETAGNRGAWMLRDDDGDRTEFITFSLWESVEAIRAFAGPDINAAVYYPEDERYLIERDATVSHYDVVDRDVGTRSSATIGHGGGSVSRSNSVAASSPRATKPRRTPSR
ncbi:MAG TPA: hypothetical protein VGL51_09385 [Solirubrobacteraceae bacterium]